VEEFKIALGLDFKPGEYDRIKAQIEELCRNRTVRIQFETSGNGDIQRQSVQLNEVNAQYREMLALIKEQGKLAARKATLNPVLNGEELAEISAQLQQIQTRYAQLVTATNGKLNTNQINALSAATQAASREMQLATQRTQDGMNNFRNSIKQKMDTGTFDSAITRLMRSYSKLNEGNRQAVTGLEELQTAYRNLKSGIGAASDREFENLYRQYTQAFQTAQNSVTAASAQQTAYEQASALANGRANLSTQMSTWLTLNSNAAARFGDTIQNMQAQLETADKTQLAGLRSQFAQIQSEAKAAGLTGLNVIDSFKAKAAELSRYLVAMFGFTAIMRATSGVVENVRSIDSAMVELRKVTDETEQAYSRFEATAGTSAYKLGTTVDNLIKSTADFARLGDYSIAQAQELAEVANTYLTVGDDLSGIEEATQSIVSTMQAFRIEVSDTMSIVDKFNEVSNNFAISSGGIGVALEKSASSLKVAGNSIDQSIAMITAANTVVQNPDSVGTAFKTISMRIRENKRNSVVQGLTGITAYVDEDSFKSTYDYIDELAAKWENLTQVQQAAVIEQLAGKHQANVFTSLVENWDVAKRALETSLNSEGSAERELANALDSVEAKANQVKTAFQALSQSLLSSDMYKGFLDGTSSAISLVNTLIKNLGTLGTAAAAGYMAFSASGRGIFSVQNQAGVGFGRNLLSTITPFSSIIQRSTSGAGLAAFDAGLAGDVAALEAYKNAATEASDLGTAFEQTMMNASQSARIYARSLDVTSISTAEYTQQQRMAYIAAQNQGVGLIGAKKVFAEYNSLQTAGADRMREYAAATAQTNATLGNYLNSLNGGTASYTAFIAQQIKARAATLALNLAQIALNMGLVALVSVLVNIIQKQAQLREEAIENGNAAADEAAEIQKLNQAYQQAFVAYKNGTGTKDELREATDSLVSRLREEGVYVNTLTDDYQKLSENIKTATEEALRNKLTNEQVGLQAAEKGLLPGLFKSPGYSMDYDAAQIIEQVMGGGRDSTELFYNQILGEADFSTAEGVLAYYEKISEIREKVSDAGLYDADVFKGFEKYYTDLSEDVDTYRTAVENVNSTVVSLAYNQSKLSADTSSMDYSAFAESVEEMAKSVKGTSGFVGTLDDATTAVLNFLSTDTRFSAWTEMFNQATGEAQKKYDELAKRLSADTAQWFTGLDSGDKKIVYDLSLKNDDIVSWDLHRLQTEFSKVKAQSDETYGSLESFYAILATNPEEDVDKTFLDYINDYIDTVDTLRSAIESIDSGDFTTQDALSLGSKFPSLIPYINDTNALRTAIKNLYAQEKQGINGKLADQINILGGSATDAGSAMLTLLDTINALDVEKNVSVGFAFDIDKEIERFNQLYEARGQSVSGTGVQREQIANIEAMFAGLDFTRITHLDEAGNRVEGLFEITANGVRLNTQVVRELQAEYEKITKGDLTEHLAQLHIAYDGLSNALDHCKKGTKQYNDIMLQMDGLQKQIEDTELLYAQYEGLTSAYNKWVLAQSSGEEGDMYDNIRSNMEAVQELYDKGLVGTNVFRSFTDIFSARDLTASGTEEVVAEYERVRPIMERFVTEGQEGAIALYDALHNVNAQWAYFANGQYNIDLGFGDDVAAAEKLGISVEGLQILLRKMEDYGWHISLDDAVQDAANLKSQLEITLEATRQKIRSLGAEPLNIDVRTGDLDGTVENVRAKIAQLENTIRYGNLSEIQINVATAQIEEAKESLAILEQRRQILNGTVIEVNVDTSQVDELTQKTAQYAQTILNTKGDVEAFNKAVSETPDEVLSTLHISADTTDFDTAAQNIAAWGQENAGVTVSVDGDTLGLETKVDSATAMKTAYVNVGLTTQGDQALNDIYARLSLIRDKVINITANVNGIDRVNALQAAIDNLSDKTVSAVAQVIGEAHVAQLKHAIDSLYNKSVFARADVYGEQDVWNLRQAIDELYSKTVYTTNIVNNIVNNHQNFFSDGTAHAQGTAFAQGNWGTPTGGEALVGELGKEILVRDGRYRVIGENAAEIIKYRKGDIIFNAEQSEQILRYGKIKHGRKRARAYADGTAFSAGYGLFRYSKSGNNAITKIEEVQPDSVEPVTESPERYTPDYSSIDRAAEEFSKKVDWIAVAIDRLERSITRLDALASSEYRAWGSRSENLNAEIGAVLNELQVQRDAASRYESEAWAVMGDDWRQGWIKSGILPWEQNDIWLNTDEGLQDRIDEAQEWYEKSLDARAEVLNLEEKVSELYARQFDNVVERWGEIIASIEQRENIIEEWQKQSDEMGRYTAEAYYMGLMSEEEEKIRDIARERTEMVEALEKGVRSGYIKEFSQAWYDMATQINDASVELVKAETALVKYQNEIRKVKWGVFDELLSTISEISSESDFLIKFFADDKLYDYYGQLTSVGQTTMGLHALNSNIYAEQAQRYGEEIKELDKIIDKSGETDQSLIDRRRELLKLQQDAILATNEEKQSIVSMVEEGIKIELSALQDTIDRYEEAIDAQKELYDYQKKVSGQTKQIATLEKQLAAYANDNSEETRQRVQQIKVSLSQAREELQETQYDKYISDQKAVWQQLYDDYERILNARLDNVDLLIRDMLDETNAAKNEISQTIAGGTDKVGYMLTDEMRMIWGGEGDAVGTLERTLDTNTDAVITSIDAASQRVAVVIEQSAKENLGTFDGLAIEKGFAGGTRSVGSSGFAWTQEKGMEAIIRRSDGAVLTPLARGDAVLNAAGTNNLFAFANNPRGFLRAQGAADVRTVSTGSFNGDVNFNVSLPNVSNYEQFKYAMQHDPQFEMMLQDMTVNQLVGGLKHKKYGYR